MILGFVSATRSRQIERVAGDGDGVGHCSVAGTGGIRPLKLRDRVNFHAGRRRRGSSREVREEETAQPDADARRLVKRTEHRGQREQNHRRREDQLKHDHAQRDGRGAHDDRRFFRAAATQHRDNADEVQKEQNGDRAVRHLHGRGDRVDR